MSEANQSPKCSTCNGDATSKCTLCGNYFCEEHINDHKHKKKPSNQNQNQNQKKHQVQKRCHECSMCGDDAEMQCPECGNFFCQEHYPLHQDF